MGKTLQSFMHPHHLPPSPPAHSLYFLTVLHRESVRDRASQVHDAFALERILQYAALLLLAAALHQ